MGLVINKKMMSKIKRTINAKLDDTNIRANNTRKLATVSMVVDDRILEYMFFNPNTAIIPKMMKNHEKIKMTIATIFIFHVLLS
jgi:hypothetical protein